jgi:hypothetical protein
MKIPGQLSVQINNGTLSGAKPPVFGHGQIDRIYDRIWPAPEVKRTLLVRFDLFPPSNLSSAEPLGTGLNGQRFWLY